MTKRSLLFLGALCAFGLFSCEKNMKDKVASDSPAANKNKPVDLPPAELTNGNPVLVKSGYAFTEGPAVDKMGNVFFTDQPNDKIYRWDASTGDISLFLTGTGRANGMAFDKNGRLIACADMHGELWSIDKFGNHEVLVDNYKGKLLNGPNDIWINPKDRGMYITDPMFPRGYWDKTDPRYIGNFPGGWPPKYSEQGPGVAGHVYYLAPGSKELVRVTENIPGWNPQSSLPNGVVGSPDGKKLYVNKWAGGTRTTDVGYPGGIWVFDINKDGTLSNMQPLVQNLPGCDGMSTDEYGNIYVSIGAGVRIYSPQGKEIKTIPIPNPGGGATNNVFGGLDQKTLFITNGSGKVFTQRMNVQGVEKFGGEHNGADNGNN